MQREYHGMPILCACIILDAQSNRSVGKKARTIHNQASLAMDHSHNCACYRVGDMSSRAVHDISPKCSEKAPTRALLTLSKEHISPLTLHCTSNDTPCLNMHLKMVSLPKIERTEKALVVKTFSKFHR